MRDYVTRTTKTQCLIFLRLTNGAFEHLMRLAQTET